MSHSQVEQFRNATPKEYPTDEFGAFPPLLQSQRPYCTHRKNYPEPNFQTSHPGTNTSTDDAKKTSSTASVVTTGSVRQHSLAHVRPTHRSGESYIWACKKTNHKSGSLISESPETSTGFDYRQRERNGISPHRQKESCVSQDVRVRLLRSGR